MTSYERVHALVDGQPVDHLAAMPIIMIWAAQRVGVSYADYCRDYRVLADCQLRLLDEFPLDVVQLISDPYRETADLGAELQYVDDGPPKSLKPPYAAQDKLPNVAISALFEEGRMADRIRGAELLYSHVGKEIPIIGWVEGPIAEAVDLRGMQKLMMDLVDEPDYVGDLMDFVVEVEIEFAQRQIEAGCDLIGIGDAAASLVSAKIYEDMVLPREQRIVRAIHEAGAVARLHICGNTRHLLGLMPQTGCEIIDLDYLFPIEEARPAMGPEPIVLGNFDPVAGLLEATEEQVYEWCRRCHEACGERHIVGPGCEVPPGTPAENVMAMLRYAQEL
ncbi:MAG: uroporphyrinogen decarboxylase family protein [Bacteroidota bacterium]